MTIRRAERPEGHQGAGEGGLPPVAEGFGNRSGDPSLPGLAPRPLPRRGDSNEAVLRLAAHETGAWHSGQSYGWGRESGRIDARVWEAPVRMCVGEESRASRALRDTRRTRGDDESRLWRSR